MMIDDRVEGVKTPTYVDDIHPPIVSRGEGGNGYGDECSCAACRSRKSGEIEINLPNIEEGPPEFIGGYLLGESPGQSGYWLFNPNGDDYNGSFDSREEALDALHVILRSSTKPQPVAQGEAVDDGVDYLHALDQADVALGVAGLDESDIFRVELRRAREHFAATPTTPTSHRVVQVEPDREVVGFTSEDVHNLHSLRRVLENLSKKRAPDPRDLDAEFFVTANINHAVTSATYWLPIVNDLYLRLYGALAEKSRNSASPSAGGV